MAPNQVMCLLLALTVPYSVYGKAMKVDFNQEAGLRQSLTIYYENPCSAMVLIQHTQKEIQWREDKNFRTRWYHYIQQQLEECQSQFEGVLLPSMRRFGKCAPQRLKRSVIGLMADTLFYVAGEVYTNFISPNFRTGKERSVDVAREDFRKNFNMQQLYDGTVSQYVNMVSESGPSHPTQVDSESHLLPPTIWAAMRVHAEILASAANFMVMTDACQNGMVATAELSEVSGNSDLALVDPSNTHLISVDLNEKEQTIVIHYIIENALHDSFWDKHGYLVIICLLNIITAVAFTLLRLLWIKCLKLHLQPQQPQQPQQPMVHLSRPKLLKDSSRTGGSIALMNEPMHDW